MNNKKWKKNFKATVSLLILAVFFVLSGCGKKEPITLKQAMENDENIKSGHYVANMAVKSAAAVEEMPMNAEISFEGAFDIESEEKGRIEANINYQMVELGMNIEIPIIMDIKNDHDADVFITIPVMFAQLLGFPEGQNILYLNTKEVVEENEQAKNEEMVNSLSKIFDNFTEKNKEIFVFEEIEDKPIESNGKYLLNLNKEQSMKFLKELFEDEEFVAVLNQLINISSSTNPLGQEESKDIEELKKEFITNLENAEEYNLQMEIIINDEFITEFKFINSVTTDGQTGEITFDFKIEKINEAVEIAIPDKNSDSVINFSELENMQMGLPIEQ